MLLLRLVKRNILVYIRDRSNVFFSLLSMLIIVGLMVVFLGKMNADGVVNLLNQYGGARDTVKDRSNADQLVMLCTLAGIIVVNSVTITLSIVGSMVEDEINKRSSSFYVSPVNRVIFVMGYILASIIMGVIMCILTVVVGEVYFVITGATLLSLQQWGMILIFILLNVFTSSSMVFLIMNFIHTQGALSGVGIIIGTLVGFFAGIYIPLGMLPSKVKTVIECIPLVHGSALLREVFTENILTKTFSNCPQDVIDGYKEYMGITLKHNDKLISHTFMIAFLVIGGIIFIIVSALLQKRRKILNR